MQQVTAQYVGPGSPGQVISYTGTAGVIANPVPESAKFLWIFVTSIAHIRIAQGSPTAVTTDFPLPASTPIIVDISNINNGTVKVSAVQSAAGGNLHVCPVAY